MGLFFGSSKSSSAAPGLNRFQKQHSSGLKKVLSGLSAEKRRKVETVLGDKAKLGVSNDRILKIVGSTVGYGAKKQVEQAMRPKVDDRALKLMRERNLKYALSSRVREQMQFQGAVSNEKILGSALKGEKGSAKDLGVSQKSSVSINQSQKPSGFAGAK